MENENDVVSFIDQEEQLIKEKYEIWKNHSPLLYDFLLTHTLEWPSLTIQWLPLICEPTGKNNPLQNFILGTRTVGCYPNYLIIAEVQLPIEDSDQENNTDSRNNNVAIGVISDKFRIVKMINHDGEVNIARYMPQKTSIIATRTDGEELYIFDCNKHPSSPPDVRVRPELRLFGHQSEGYGLCWSTLKSGHLLSGANDSTICVWDIDATPKNRTLDALRIFKFNEGGGGVEDVAWHMENENLFGSVGNKYLKLWDIREPLVSNPVQYCVAHSDKVNCLSFNPLLQWAIITGSSDTTTKLWDIRKINKNNDHQNCVHTFKHDDGEVFQVGWNPKNETVFASGCHDGRVLVWDLDHIGNNIQTHKATPPELIFVHGGHTNMISDFSWNPYHDMMIASVSADNSVHVWKRRDDIYTF